MIQFHCSISIFLLYSMVENFIIYTLNLIVYYVIETVIKYNWDILFIIMKFQIRIMVLISL